MSRTLYIPVYTDESVTNVSAAERLSEEAVREQKRLKEQLWGLIISTPKDVTPEGEDPIQYLSDVFGDIWDSMWDAFVDDFKYSSIAEDAEYNEESMVLKVWKNIEEEEKEMRRASEKRDEFFRKHEGVLNKYNFNDIRLYDEYLKGNISIGDNFTAEDRQNAIDKIKEGDEKVIEEALKKFKDKKNYV